MCILYIGGSQHVLRVDERPEQAHQLDSSSQLWVRVTDHLLDHDIYKQNILKKTHTTEYTVNMMQFWSNHTITLKEKLNQGKKRRKLL